MSAAFKNAKHKLSQAKLRQLMSEHKNKLKPVQKIDSPLAKYSETGQLLCILCQTVVRSESVWKVHVNSKVHKENIELAKKLKEQTSSNASAAVKRAASPSNSTGAVKKIKSILKNSSATTDSTQNLPEDFFDTITKPDSYRVPADGARNVNNNNNNNADATQAAAEAAMKMNNMSSEVLPEGFFDDPKLDAKARNLEYKDPIEEQWERFQKEIKEVDHKSAEIIAEDQEEATTERQIDEIEEQMRNWSRVLDLERKKEIVKVTVDEVMNESVDGPSDEDDDNFDEFLDWRSKKSFK